MALKIRLARAGSKKRPYYHIVVAAATSPRDGKYIDVVGSFNPLLAKTDENRVKLDTAKAADWLKKGAQPTDRVLRFLDKAGLKKRDARNNPQKALPGKKRQEREKAAADAVAKARAVTDDESAWLQARMDANGVIDELDQAVLDFLKEEEEYRSRQF